LGVKAKLLTKGVERKAYVLFGKEYQARGGKKGRGGKFVYSTHIWG